MIKLPKKSVLLEEHKPDGKVIINCTLLKDSLMFLCPEENVLPYLDGNIDGARRCCDKIIFKQIDALEARKCELHVMEFKTTIDHKKINEDIRPQIKMGILNGRAIAAFLDLEIINSTTYSAFIHDKINNQDMRYAPILMRAMNNPKVATTINDWNSNRLRIDMDGDNYETFSHIKITLNADGCEEIII